MYHGGELVFRTTWLNACSYSDAAVARVVPFQSVKTVKARFLAGCFDVRACRPAPDNDAHVLPTVRTSHATHYYSSTTATFATLKYHTHNTARTMQERLNLHPTSTSIGARRRPKERNGVIPQFQGKPKGQRLPVGRRRHCLLRARSHRCGRCIFAAAMTLSF